MIPLHADDHGSRIGPVAATLLLAAALVAGCGDAGSAASPSNASAASSAAAIVTPSAAATVAATAAPSARASAAASIGPSPVPSDGHESGEARTDAWGIDQVWVPAGTFRMGTSAAAITALQKALPPDWVAIELPSEQPAHDVTLTHGYWIDRTEVTNKAFDAFVAAGGYTTEALWSKAGWAWLVGQDAARLPLPCQGDVPEQPRLCVTWFEAEAYATWRAGRLPTEAQWEYAARGPESAVYPWGDRFDASLANVVDSTGPKPVGSYRDGVSWVNADDMAGNAMEWVADWLDPDYYATSPAKDPSGPATGKVKVEKGGWWGSNAFVARSAYRQYEDPPTYGDKHIGFRIVSH
jgi:formylglycine-generating enzyme required for sulfatase activity